MSLRRIWIVTLAFFTTSVLGLSLVAAQPPEKSESTQNPAPLQNPNEQTHGRNADSRKPDAESQLRDQANNEAAIENSRREQQRPRLGLKFNSQADAQPNQPEQGGLAIADVEVGSLAAKAGFEKNDRILQVDGYRFRSSRQLQAYLSNLGGRRVPFVVERDGERKTISVMLPEQEGGAWLGVYLQESPEGQGAVVTNVYPASPAARAGLRPGDVITKLNDEKILGAEDLVTTVDEMSPQAEAKFTVTRQDQEIQLTAQLSNRENVFYRGQNSFDEGRHFPDACSPQRSSAGREFDEIPPFAMQLEHDRRSAEQRQRIEAKVDDLRKEIQELRKLLETKK